MKVLIREPPLSFKNQLIIWMEFFWQVYGIYLCSCTTSLKNMMRQIGPTKVPNFWLLLMKQFVWKSSPQICWEEWIGSREFPSSCSPGSNILETCRILGHCLTITGSWAVWWKSEEKNNSTLTLPTKTLVHSGSWRLVRLVKDPL